MLLRSLPEEVDFLEQWDAEDVILTCEKCDLNILLVLLFIAYLGELELL